MSDACLKSYDYYIYLTGCPLNSKHILVSVQFIGSNEVQVVEIRHLRKNVQFSLNNLLNDIRATAGSRAPSQYLKRRLSLRSREVSKPRDWYFELSYRSEIWQAHRQQCCRSACQISERSDNSKYKSRGFETLRDITKRRLFRYWDGAQGVFRDESDLVRNSKIDSKVRSI